KIHPTTTVSSCVLFVMAFNAVAQGTFQNLNFESANVSPANARGFFPITNVLPNWTGYLGTNQVSQAFYNGVSAGAALVSLISSNTPFSEDQVIGGKYTAVLATGEDQVINSSGAIVSAAIAQGSLVPLT